MGPTPRRMDWSLRSLCAVKRGRSCLPMQGIVRIRLPPAPDEQRLASSPAHESGLTGYIVSAARQARCLPDRIRKTSRRVDRPERALVAPTKAKELSRSVSAAALDEQFVR